MTLFAPTAPSAVPSRNFNSLKETEARSSVGSEDGSRGLRGAEGAVGAKSVISQNTDETVYKGAPGGSVAQATHSWFQGTIPGSWDGAPGVGALLGGEPASLPFPLPLPQLVRSLSLSPKSIRNFFLKKDCL